MILTPAELERISAQATAEYPSECCGVLLERGAPEPLVGLGLCGMPDSQERTEHDGVISLAAVLAASVDVAVQVDGSKLGDAVDIVLGPRRAGRRPPGADDGDRLVVLDLAVLVDTVEEFAESQLT